MSAERGSGSGSESLPTREEVVCGIERRVVVVTPEGAVIPGADYGSGPAPDAIAARLVGRIGGTPWPRDDARFDRITRRFGWAEPEPAADHGHLRFSPDGALLRGLLQAWHHRVAAERLDALEIRTPTLFRWREDDLRSQAASFHRRLYFAGPHGREPHLVMRFGGDFGLFRMLGDTPLTHARLPLRVFEFAESFRRQRRGELHGLDCTRAFGFFDQHSVCADRAQGRAEYRAYLDAQVELADQLGMRYTIHFTALDAWFERGRAWLIERVEALGRPVVVELLSRPKHYWLIQHKFVAATGEKFFNVQLDFDNAERYGIEYRMPDGQRRGAVICHASSGSMERWMRLVLRVALERAPPSLPTWLAPTQLRVVPVADRHVEAATALARRVRARRVRADVDDRPHTVSWRIRRAARRWIPFIVVYGDDEARGGPLAVRRRGQGQASMSFDGLVAAIEAEVGDHPRRVHGPVALSRGWSA